MCKNCKPVAFPVSANPFKVPFIPALPVAPMVSTVPANLLASYPYFGQPQLPGFEGFPCPKPIPAPSHSELHARFMVRIGAVKWDIIPIESDEEDEEDTTDEEEETISCEDCGAEITDGEEVTIDGDVYCNECCNYCECCEKYVVNNYNDSWDKTRECSVCAVCVERYYTTCEDCGELVQDSDTRDGYCMECASDKYECYGCNHLFDGDDINSFNDEYYCDECKPEVCYGECEQNKTTIMLKGIDQDERVTITVSDEEVISPDGFMRVLELIQKAGFSSYKCHFRDMSRAVTNEKGKFATRLGALIQTVEKDTLERLGVGNVKKLEVTINRTRAKKLPCGTVERDERGHVQYTTEEVKTNFLSEVGNIVSQHTLKTDAVECSFTRDLNQSAGYFGNSGSCWFGDGDYSKSRCMLKFSGGFGFLTHEGNETTGRVWVLPVVIKKEDGKRATARATEDEETANGFVCFNGYNDNASNPTAFMSSVFAKFVDMEKIKLNFDVSGMYLNNSYAYLVATPDALKAYDGATYLNVNGMENCGCWND